MRRFYYRISETIETAFFECKGKTIKTKWKKCRLLKNL